MNLRRRDSWFWTYHLNHPLAILGGKHSLVVLSDCALEAFEQRASPAKLCERSAGQKVVDRGHGE